jgi:hypothetical protein
MKEKETKDLKMTSSGGQLEILTCEFGEVDDAELAL